MIGFIGAGKVGTSLGKYLSEKGVELSGYYSRTDSQARLSASFTASSYFTEIGVLVQKSDVIFITVPDDSIGTIWFQLKSLNIKGKIICHTSGVLSSAVFEDAESTGASVFSVHPMLAVSSRVESWMDFDKAFFTVEGKDERIDEIKAIFIKTDNPVRTIDADMKTLYHVACVFVSNLVVGLAGAGRELFVKCGLDEEFADDAWKSLFLTNARNIAKTGLSEALTGPVERADSETVHKHLEILERREETIYRELSRMILDIAKGKNPERDYTNIDKELK